MIAWAKPSTMAVLPTPASPSRTGLFFGSTAEDLNHPFDFIRPADDRIELFLTSQFGEIPAETIKRRGFGLSALLGSPFSPRIAAIHAMPEKVEDLFAHFVELEIEVHEDLGGYSLLLSQESQQQMLGADVVVIEITRLFDGVFDNFLRSGCVGKLSPW